MGHSVTVATPHSEEDTISSGKNQPWEVYIVQTESGKLYTGITTDVKRRFAEHTGKTRGAKFFRTSRPKKIVFAEKHKDRASASAREAEIKKMTRGEKLALIEGTGEEGAGSGRSQAGRMQGTRETGTGK